jgi:hypothetical protein
MAVLLDSEGIVSLTRGRGKVANARFRKWFPGQMNLSATVETTSKNAVANLQAATAAFAPSSPVLRRLSMLSAPAPNVAICSSPPAIITFLRKWIIWF